MAEPQAETEYAKKPVEVRLQDDIPLKPNEFVFNGGQFNELKNINPIVVDAKAMTVYKVTSESDQGKVIDPFEMATLNMSTFTDSLLVHNTDFTKDFLGVVIGQIKNDINTAMARKTFVDFKIDKNKLRLIRSQRLMVNNIKSAQLLLGKLDTLGITKGDDFKELLTQFEEQITTSKKLFVDGQGFKTKLEDDEGDKKKLVFSIESDGEEKKLDQKELNLSFQEITYRDGSLFAKGDTASRKRSGPWEWYRRDGSLIRKGDYHLASRTGVWTWFDRQGNITKTVDYGDKTKK